MFLTVCGVTKDIHLFAKSESFVFHLFLFILFLFWAIPKSLFQKIIRFKLNLKQLKGLISVKFCAKDTCKLLSASYLRHHEERSKTKSSRRGMLASQLVSWRGNKCAKCRQSCEERIKHDHAFCNKWQTRPWKSCRCNKKQP